jgi:hypothetical protein
MVYPVSSFWKVIRSTTPESVLNAGVGWASWAGDGSCFMVGSLRIGVSLNDYYDSVLQADCTDLLGLDYPE